MNLETKITIYKFTPQLFTLTQKIADSVAFFESHEKTTDMYHTSLIRVSGFSWLVSFLLSV